MTRKSARVTADDIADVTAKLRDGWQLHEKDTVPGLENEIMQRNSTIVRMQREKDRILHALAGKDEEIVQSISNALASCAGELRPWAGHTNAAVARMILKTLAKKLSIR